MLFVAFLKKLAIVNPWTEWAARSFIADYDVDPARIRVLPPGVDTTFWRPAQSKSSRDVPRAIFVGGDFARKGGDLLLSVFRERFPGRLELDLVTRAEVDVEPGIRIHRDLSPNDPRLLDLYQQADFFVLPTRADCFPMAGIEAMSTGLPLIMSSIAGIGEMFESGRQGYHVPADDGDALATAIESLVSSPGRRAEMGAEARSLALSRYDTHRNTAKLLALFEEAT
jgi:glycosyltransferase involved in cell wall biosynthesis